jgi:NADH-quinone oxidoreductase subunit H
MDAVTVRDIAIALVRIVAVFTAHMAMVPVLVMAERRICAAIQDRIGPNRVGPFGILQPLADGLKNIFKEDLVPGHVDKFLYTVSPLLALAPPLLMFAVIPFGSAITLTPGGVHAAALLALGGGMAGTAALAAAGLWAGRRGPGSAWLRLPLLGMAALATPAGVGAWIGLEALSGTLPPEGLVVRLQIADLPAGVLFCMAMISMGVYAVALGGWASNDKYSLLGALRASAQMISYEIVLGLSVILVIMSTSHGVGTGTVQMSTIVERQTETLTWFGVPVPGWNVFHQPIAFLFFVLAGFAENKRLPFDLPECEAELVGGYHTEYSSMKFALFMMGEYLSMVAISAVTVTLFLGGWHVPGLDPSDASLVSGLASVASFAIKTMAILFVYIWVRWSIPRFRYDQLMNLGWKVMVPVAFANFVLSAVVGIL